MSYEKKKNLRVIVEVQLNKSDQDHFNRIVELYSEKVKNAIIIWVAPSFDKLMVEKVIQDLNFNYARNIDFYALTFNDEILSILDKLNNQINIDLTDSIAHVTSPDLKVYDWTRTIPDNYVAEKQVEPKIDRASKNNYVLRHFKRGPQDNTVSYKVIY